jgi:molecular chaperone GrpE
MKTDEPNGTRESKEEKPELRVVDRRWWARGETTDATDVGGRKPTFVEDLERRLAEATTELQSALSEHRRALDEFEQAKGRIRREVGREVERGRRAVLTELLDVLDNLDRAIGSARRSDAPDEVQGLARGVELVREQFRAKLEAFGVMLVPASGQPFDAARHEAVSIVPVTDPTQDGIVVAVIREGYAIGDDLLRPASVVVGKMDEPSEWGPRNRPLSG